jgi:hypothetical protein
VPASSGGVSHLFDPSRVIQQQNPFLHGRLLQIIIHHEAILTLRFDFILFHFEEKNEQTSDFKKRLEK